ncbi:MAG TPA: alkaline phosphatase family protein [Acidimicrobiales bacterium]|nr:alkaline phosphatase family protein [Acidimicrobiales bacterium]
MITRRSFLRLAGASAGLAAAGAAVPGAGVAQAASLRRAARAASPTAADLGIEHVVILMLENRSFDHLLGWLPRADGTHAGTYTAPNGNAYPNYPLAPDFQGCGYSDADHSWEGWLVEYDYGRCDGFLMRPGQFANSPHAAVNTFPIGYYTDKDLPVLAALAQNYTTLDRYFCSIAAETYPNRFYQHSAQTDRDHNSGGPTTSVIPAIWDQLSPAPGAAAPGSQPTGAYYFQDAPFVALWGQKYAQFVRPYSSATPVPSTGVIDGSTLPPITIPPQGESFLDAIRNGTLPNVSYVDPSFVDEGAGTSDDDHPLADVRLGDKVIADVYHALGDAGLLSSTILVVTFDEWGGFYDHVPPPKVVDDTDPAKVSHTGNTPTQGQNYPDYGQLGFRVPCVVVSPFGGPAIVGSPTDEGPYEHTSSLAMIQSLWGLKPMTARDANANNLLNALDLSTRSKDDPRAKIPTSADVGGPAVGAAAACGTPLSAASVSPDPVAPGGAVPEFPLTTVLPVTLGLGVAGAGIAARQHRIRAAAATAAPEEEA